MTYCPDREVRKLFYDTKNAFASEGKYDNREIILKILKLKDEKAKIMGYKNYAEYSLQTKMATSPEEVIDLIEDVFEKGKSKAISEMQEIQTFFGLTDFYYWDFAYYTRKYKEEKYNFDAKVLKNYFEFEKVLAGLFTIAQKLYGLNFIEIHDAKQVQYDPLVRFYKVEKD